MYPSDSSSSLWHQTSSSSSSYDDSDSHISSADEETSWMAMVSDVAGNNSSSSPTIGKEPTASHLACLGGDRVSNFADRVFTALFVDEVNLRLTFYGRNRDMKAIFISPLDALILGKIMLIDYYFMCTAEVLNLWNNPLQTDKLHSSYDDSNSEISSADKETSWTSDVSDVATNNSLSTPTIEEGPTVREAISSWAIRSRITLIHLSSLLKIIRWLTSDLLADARTLLVGVSDVSMVTAMASGENVH
ncbi:unnamed protein product [Schistocephalus solidus]|uniref:FSA_C domain-containing protein n=1 Tax=Schistocephalus solidus TaxID=70667 RepID=A0A183T9X4_SCHSO|nr:unnamed protein product [Schistocephalus solidus]